MSACAVTVLASVSIAGSNGPSSPSRAALSRADLSASTADQTLVLERFLSFPDQAPIRYRARRRLESARGDTSGWLQVLTEFHPDTGFRYHVSSEGGSEQIRARALRPILKAEERAWRTGNARKGALTRTNYEFQPAERDVEGLLKFLITPRRKDTVLVDGSIALTPDKADLVSVQGRLAKSPSFWISRVDIVRRFGRLRGALVPLSVESTRT